MTERPYPEAPLASRRADPKPAKRIRDKGVFSTFHARGHDCLSCGHGRFIQAHHVLGRGQGGDDVLANLVPLCNQCHGALHGHPYRAYGVRIDAAWVRRALARHVRSEPGTDTRFYLRAKLGEFPAEAFVQRMEA